MRMDVEAILEVLFGLVEHQEDVKIDFKVKEK